MTTLVALNAKIRGDASGFVKATNQAGLAADKLTQKVGGTGPKGVTGATNKMTGAFSKLSGSNAMRMLPMQFSQVAQQAAAGGGVMRALTIQAADIGLAFGTVGTIIGILATVSMPILISMFSGTEEKVDELEKALEGFSSALSRVSSAADIARKPIDELRETYGKFAAEVQRASRVVAQAALAEAMREYRESASAASELTDEFSRALANNKAAMEAVANNAKLAGGPLEKVLKNSQKDAEQTTAALEEAAAALGMSVHETNLLVGAMARMEAAEGPEALAAAASSALDALDQIFDTTTNIPPEVAAIIEHLRTVQLEASAATEDFEAMGDAARSVRVGGGGRGDPRQFTNMDEFREQLAGQNGEEDEDDKKNKGLSEEERELAKTEADFERLQDKFRTELELEAKHYAAQQQLLNEALDAELLTREEYDSLNEEAKKAHLAKMAQIDAYAHGSTVQQTEKFMGDMASALQNGNEKMMAIGKAFGAAQALINAWTAYSQVAADPTLPWFAKIPAALGVFASAVKAVDAIKGVSKGGGSTTASGGGGGGNAGAVEGGAAAPVAQQRSLTLIGDRFNRQQAVSIAEFMNEGADDGLVIKGAR